MMTGIVRVFLLHKKVDWSYEQFMSFHKIVSLFCSESYDNCITNSSTKVKETLRAKIDANYSFELMNRFEEAFTVIIYKYVF